MLTAVALCCKLCQHNKQNDKKHHSTTKNRIFIGIRQITTLFQGRIWYILKEPFMSRGKEDILKPHASTPQKKYLVSIFKMPGCERNFLAVHPVSSFILYFFLWDFKTHFFVPKKYFSCLPLSFLWKVNKLWGGDCEYSLDSVSKRD